MRKARGAKILAEVVGYGATCDAYHITSPARMESGAARAMEFAMKEAGVAPEEVTYINAHGTSPHITTICLRQEPSRQPSVTRQMM